MDPSLTDPLAFILTAITTGAAASAQTTTNQAIKDAYEFLRDKLLHTSSNKSAIQDILSEVQADPIGWAAPLKRVLVQEQMAQDSEVLEAAKQMMARMVEHSASPDQYSNQFHAPVQSVIQGTGHSIDQQFGFLPPAQQKE